LASFGGNPGFPANLKDSLNFSIKFSITLQLVVPGFSTLQLRWARALFNHLNSFGKTLPVATKYTSRKATYSGNHKKPQKILGRMAEVVRQASDQTSGLDCCLY